MLKKCTKPLLWNSYASFATKIKKSVLLQDKEQIPVISYPTSSELDRRVYVWGLSETGALGVNKSLKKQSLKQAAFIQHPTRLQFAENKNVIDVACGYGFTAIAVKCTADGLSLFGTGINTDGQLGYHKHGGETNKPIEQLIYPAPIQLLSSSLLENVQEKPKIQIKQCAAGRAHLMALSENGYVYTLGNNSYGQCGRPIIENEKYSNNVIVHEICAVGGELINTVHCGQDHSLFLTKSGRLYSCGWGADGQTGLGHYNCTSEPSLIGGDISTERIIKVAGTADCVLALNDKGEVFGWGNSEYNQLGTTDGNQQVNSPKYLTSLKGVGKIVDIAAGGPFCLVVNDNGDVFVWGYGILGLGPQADNIPKPTRIPATLFGRNDFNPNSRVVSVSCGIGHMAALNDQNDAYTWGLNKFGCLGLGHKNDQFFPFKVNIGAKVLQIKCGVDHTVAICKPFS